MNYLRSCALVAAALLCMPVCAAAGELSQGIYVAAHDYVVTVSPVDAESRNAENSDLYQREGVDQQWVNLGKCEKITLPNHDVRFIKTVSVDKDGTYHYTSRPVVGGKVASPPDRTSPDQAVVIVDTLAPIAEITKPEDSVKATAGDSLEIAWTARDENIADHPVDLAWSPDGGQTWISILEGAAAAGDTTWTIPDDASGPAALRVTAIDKAGNRGTALRQVEIAALPTKAVEAKQEEQTPEIAGETPEPAEETTQSEPKKTVEEYCEEGPSYDKNRSWLYYLMAVNLMRQNNPKDALQYYWLSVKADPEFVDAWADIILAYIDVGTYKTARKIADQTRDLAPGRIDLMHLTGETYHAEGMDLLGRAKTTEERLEAQALIDQAVLWYGIALEKASEEWKLAERAPSYYRLGEICYCVNMDPEGARAYWMKILDLHAPTPNPDLVLWANPKERPLARRNLERQTYMRVSLEAWQNWARGYIMQLDERERQGIVDLMPANRINRYNPTGNAGDGKSIFSLPSQYGSPGPVPASSGSASTAAPRQTRPVEEYSFYAAEERSIEPQKQPPKRWGGKKRSALSGGPDIPQPQPVDPYSFPMGNRSPAEWNNAGRYGDKPVDNW